MASDELRRTVAGYENYIAKNGVDEQAIDAYCAAVSVAFGAEKDNEYGLKLSARAKELIERIIQETSGCTFWELERYAQDNGLKYGLIDKYYNLLRTECLDRFESFIYYMEKNRRQEKRFYLPRRHTLSIVLDDLQDLESRKIKFYGLSLPPRVGKSTLNIFFLAWIALKRPNSHSAMGGHSGILADLFYKELMNLITTEEYTFSELYFHFWPKYKKKGIPTDKNAEQYKINLGDPDGFATITCRGIDGTWTGAVDVSQDGYLYIDDLVRDRVHALSPTRMEGTFQDYQNKMVDRMNDGARQLMVGTLWSVLDPLERIRVTHENDPLYRFRRIPALNDDDESNFQYAINGFSTEYYRDMRDKLEKADWMAKYQQRPFVREGLLFPVEELRTFDSDNVMPEGSYRVVAVCDPAFGGGDSLSMPICAEHENGKKYIIDWIFNRGTQAVTVPLIVRKIQEHDIVEIVLEKNAGGSLLRDIIDERLKEVGNMHCRVTTKIASNKMSKDDKIVAYSDYVKENMIFLLPNYAVPTDDVVRRYKRSEEYSKAIEELTMYTAEGRNVHDDAADSLAQLAIYLEKKAVKRAVIMASPI